MDDTRTSERAGEKRPIVSLILCSRNDRYQGDSVWRLQTALNATVQAVAAIGREQDVEIILVDWGSKVPLREALCLTPATARQVSFLYLSQEIIKEVAKDSPFAEVLALNAAARRAKGLYIGRIDQDTVPGPEFMRRMIEILEGKFPIHVLPETAMFLSNRRCIPYRFASRSPSLWCVNRFVKWFGRNLPLMSPLPPELFYQSFVGIWMLHRDLWEEARGFDEEMIYMEWMEVDMYLRLRPKYTLVNLGELIDHDVYHLDHLHPFAHWGTLGRSRKTNPVRDYDHPPKTRRPNGPDWGLVNFPIRLEPYAPTVPDLQARVERDLRPAWPSFIWAVAVSRARTLLDRAGLMVFRALLALPRLIVSRRPEWKGIAGRMRAVVHEQPMYRWPGLILQSWAKRRPMGGRS